MDPENPGWLTAEGLTQNTTDITLPATTEGAVQYPPDDAGEPLMFSDSPPRAQHQITSNNSLIGLAQEHVPNPPLQAPWSQLSQHSTVPSYVPAPAVTPLGRSESLAQVASTAWNQLRLQATTHTWLPPQGDIWFIPHPTTATQNPAVYATPPTSDPTIPGDHTSFVASQAYLSNENLPQALGFIDYTQDTSRYSGIQLLLDATGRPIIGAAGGELYGFAVELPNTISRNVEGFRLAYWLRIDPRIKLPDIVNRFSMQPGQPHMTVKELRKWCNAISMRHQRWCAQNGGFTADSPRVIGKVARGQPAVPRQHVMVIERALHKHGVEALLRNNTWDWSENNEMVQPLPWSSRNGARGPQPLIAQNHRFPLPRPQPPTIRIVRAFLKFVWAVNFARSQGLKDWEGIRDTTWWATDNNNTPHTHPQGDLSVVSRSSMQPRRVTRPKPGSDLTRNIETSNSPQEQPFRTPVNHNTIRNGIFDANGNFSSPRGPLNHGGGPSYFTRHPTNQHPPIPMISSARHFAIARNDNILAAFNQEQQQKWESLLVMQQEARNLLERTQQEARALFEHDQAMQNYASIHRAPTPSTSPAAKKFRSESENKPGDSSSSLPVQLQTMVSPKADTTHDAGFTDNIEVIQVEPEIEEPLTPPKVTPNLPTTPLSIRTRTMDASFSVQSVHEDAPVVQSVIGKVDDESTQDMEMDDMAFGV